MAWLHSNGRCRNMKQVGATIVVGVQMLRLLGRTRMHHLKSTWRRGLGKLSESLRSQKSEGFSQVTSPCTPSRHYMTLIPGCLGSDGSLWIPGYRALYYILIYLFNGIWCFVYVRSAQDTQTQGIVGFGIHLPNPMIPAARLIR